MRSRTAGGISFGLLSGLLGVFLAAWLGISGGGFPTQSRTAADPNYTIRAIRYANLAKFPLAELVTGAPKDRTIDIAMIFWVIQGGGRTILFDSGCHRQKWIEEYGLSDFLSPDQAVKQAGIEPDSVTDIIISHAHWDHMDGIDLFPKATIWIQKAEYEYYSGAAWQPGGKHGGIEPEDVLELVRRNERGQLRFVDGDDVEIIPGIQAYTGSRHTFASQYIRVGGEPAYVLASDNCYLYENLRTHSSGATFDPSDAAGNIAQQARMITLAGSADRVVPGHDPEQFKRFPTTGRIAQIR
jgi:glyoxylase-like metal-dependent hydrolase (beta-lactamase superfamily II)